MENTNPPKAEEKKEEQPKHAEEHPATRPDEKDAKAKEDGKKAEEKKEESKDKKEEGKKEEKEEPKKEERPPISTYEDVNQSIVHNKRPLLKIKFYTRRREFESDNITLNEKEADEPKEIKSKESKSYGDQPINRMIIDAGFQAGNRMRQYTCQHALKGFSNNSVQYDPQHFLDTSDSSTKSTDSSAKRDLIEEEKLKEQEKKRIQDLEKFVEKVAQRVEEALESNELINVFQDDFSMLGSQDNVEGEKLKALLNLKLSISDSMKEKGRRVQDIQVCPHFPSMVAISMIDSKSFAERAEKSGKSIEGEILIWEYIEPTSLVMSLKSPIEVTVIKFHPTDPTILLAGLLNGQLALYRLPDLEKEKSREKKIDLKFHAISSVKKSHTAIINEIKFFPDKYTPALQKMIPGNDKKQIVCTVGDDGYMIFWDIASFESNYKQNKDKKDYIKEKAPKYGQQKLKYFHKIKVNDLENNEIGLTKIILAPEKSDKLSEAYVATDEGGIELVNYLTRVDPYDNTKLNPALVKEFDSERNYRPCINFMVHPVFPDIMLSIHDFHFCIWKIGLDKPLFRSSYIAGAHIVCGSFSPTRSGIEFNQLLFI